MNSVAAGVLAGLALFLAGCSPAHLVRADGASVKSIHRVVVIPFSDDPLVLGSGVRAAAFFQRQALLRIKQVEWVGPLEVMKDAGVQTEGIVLDDNQMAAPQAMEPLLAKMMKNEVLDPFFGKKSAASGSVLPAEAERKLAQRYHADAILRGSVLLDPGGGMIESLLTQSRDARAALAIQLVDAQSGRVLAALRQKPAESRNHPSENQLLREAAEEAVEKWSKAW